MHSTNKTQPPDFAKCSTDDVHLGALPGGSKAAQGVEVLEFQSTHQVANFCPGIFERATAGQIFTRSWVGRILLDSSTICLILQAGMSTHPSDSSNGEGMVCSTADSLPRQWLMSPELVPVHKKTLFSTPRLKHRHTLRPWVDGKNDLQLLAELACFQNPMIPMEAPCGHPESNCFQKESFAPSLYLSPSLWA